MLNYWYHAYKLVRFSSLDGISFEEILEYFEDEGPYSKFKELAVDENFKAYIWTKLVGCDNISIYSLSEDDTKNQTKPSKKRTKYSKKKEDFIYFIYDNETGVYGYSKNYYYRQEVTTSIREKYKNVNSLEFIPYQGLVFVACQAERELSLRYQPASDFSYVTYGLLELIGKNREKGIPQESLVNYNIESTRSHYDIKKLLANHLIVKLSSYTAYPEIPQNILIVTSLYDCHKLSFIYYLDPDTLRACPFDYYVTTTYDVIRQKAGSLIIEVFEKVASVYPDIGLFNFKNCLVYLIRANLIHAYKDQSVLSEKKMKTIFKCSTKIIGQDNVELYDDFWIKDPKSSNWQLTLTSSSIQLESSAEKINDSDTVLPVITSDNVNNYSLCVPYERNLISYIRDIIKENNSIGITKKRIADSLGIDSEFLKRVLHYLEKQKSISSKLTSIGNTRFYRYYTPDDLETDTSIAISLSGQHKCSLNLDVYIDKMNKRMVCKKRTLEKPDLRYKLEFVISYLESQNCFIENTEKLLKELNIYESNHFMPKTPPDTLENVIKDLILLNICKRLSLGVRFNRNITRFNVLTLDTDEMTPNPEELGKYFIMKMKEQGLEDYRMNDPDFYVNILRLIRSKTNLNIIMAEEPDFNFPSPLFPTTYNDFIQKQSNTLKRLAKIDFIKGIPKYTKVKLCHMYLSKTRMKFENIYKSKPNFEDIDPFILDACSYMDSKLKNNWFNVRDSLYKMPLIIFIYTISTHLQENVHLFLIDLKDKYLWPMEQIISQYNLNINLIFSKYSSILNDLFTLRLLGASKESIHSSVKYNNYYLVKNVSIKGKQPDNQEKTFEFKCFNDVCQFWMELRKLSLKYSYQFKKSKKRDRLKVITIRNYIIKLPNIKTDEIVIYNDPNNNGFLGFYNQLRLYSPKNWIYKPSLDERDIPRRHSLKRKRIEIQEYEGQLNDSYIFFSSKIEKIMVQAYIICMIKKDRFQFHYTRAHNYCEKNLGIELTVKSIKKYFSAIHRNEFFKPIFRKIINYVVTHNDYEAINTPGFDENQYVMMVELIARIFQSMSGSINGLDELNGNYRILSLSNKKMSRHKLYDFGSEKLSEESRKIYKILLAFIINHAISIRASEAELQYLYNTVGYTQTIYILKDLYNKSIFSKFNRKKIDSTILDDNYIIFCKIYNEYMDNISLKIIKKANSLLNPLYNLNDINKINYDVFTNLVHDFLQSKISIEMSEKEGDRNFSIELKDFSLNNCKIKIEESSCLNPQQFVVNVQKINIKKIDSDSVVLKPKIDRYQIFINELKASITKIKPKVNFTEELTELFNHNIDYFLTDGGIRTLSEKLSISFSHAQSSVNTAIIHTGIVLNGKLYAEDYALNDNLTFNLDEDQENSIKFIKELITSTVYKFPGIKEVDLLHKCSTMIPVEDILLEIEKLVKHGVLSQLVLFDEYIFFDRPSSTFKCYSLNLLL